MMTINEICEDRQDNDVEGELCSDAVGRVWRSEPAPSLLEIHINFFVAPCLLKTAKPSWYDSYMLVYLP